MPGSAVLVLNAGSSSVKFGVFGTDGDGPRLVAKGTLDDAGATPRIHAADAAGAPLAGEEPDGAGPPGDGLRHLLDWVDRQLGHEHLAGVGHRVVHGGRSFHRPVLLTRVVLAELERMVPLAPLHQPRSLDPVRALLALRPELPQVACFDTGFHHALAPPVSRYALPRRFEDEGLRKYGFHGLSYEFIAGHIAETAPELARGRTVVAHLGSGASLCAMRDGRSLDTTMGFTALDGLVMGTRCGALDPGVVLYLQRVHGLSVEAVEQLLYRESGLLGVSGASADVRALLASGEPAAREALDLFAHSAARHVAAMAHSLGGLDGLVFTGGIGEHVPEVRAAICDRLAWLDVRLDPVANREGSGRIGEPAGRVDVRVIPTDEEVVIARHALPLLAARP